MPASAIPAVKDAVESRLTAAEALKGVAIFRGRPSPGPAEYIALWKTSATREYSGLRGGAATAPLAELIDLTIVVDVALASGADQAPAEARAYELFGGIEDALRADLTLGGAWRFDRISKVEDDFFREDKRKGCRVFLTVSGKAQI
jgi:hypothetical protein